MGEVISLRDQAPVDPILRRGDLVRMICVHELFDQLEAEGCELDEEMDADDFEGAVGVVTGVELVLPPCHSDAPGQAMYVNIAVPTGEGWEEFNAISIEHLHRVLGNDANELRGWGG